MFASIRSRLLAMVVMSIGFLVLLAGVNLYGQKQSAAALEAVETRGVKPMLAIQDQGTPGRFSAGLAGFPVRHRPCRHQAGRPRTDRKYRQAT